MNKQTLLYIALGIVVYLLFFRKKKQTSAVYKGNNDKYGVADKVERVGTVDRITSGTGMTLDHGNSVRVINNPQTSIK